MTCCGRCTAKICNSMVGTCCFPACTVCDCPVQVFCTDVVIHRFAVNNVARKILTPRKNSYLSDSWPDSHLYSRTLKGEQFSPFGFLFMWPLWHKMECCRKWKTHVPFLDCSWYLSSIIPMTSELFVLILLKHCCVSPVLLHSRSWDRFWGNREQVFLTDACRTWRGCLLPGSWAGRQPGTVQLQPYQ